MKIDGYKFGNKNNWRRWVWNRICEKLDVPKKEALVIYLPGKEDLDRAIAISKKFHPANLIAVDRNRSVINTLKEKGVLCLQADILDVMMSFKYTNAKIDAIICDFCCGITKDMSNLSISLGSHYMSDSFSKNSVVVLNFLRGRDKSPLVDFNKYSNIDNKHRGKMFFNSYAYFLGLLYDDTKNRKKGIYLVEYEVKSKEYEFDTTTCKRIAINSTPQFNSYKSKNMVMDSVVFTYDNTYHIQAIDERDNSEKIKKLVRKLTALLAIRTMRKNGKLSPCPSV